MIIIVTFRLLNLELKQVNMKNFYILIASLLSVSFTQVSFAQCEGIDIASLSNPGPFAVQTLTEADGIRNGPQYSGATIYYPTNATPPFASIAIVPGFTAAPSSVEEWGPFYASHGIVAIIIGTNSSFDFPEARATALIDALETIKQENVRNTSPLQGVLDLDKLAVSGWSMGGGGAQRAAVLDNSIAGVVALCPYLLSPQLNHQSPVLIFSGQSDPTAPPALHADLHYNATPSTTNKALFEVANGNHSVANTPTGGNGAVGRIALSWLKVYVDEDDCYCSLLSDNQLLSSPVASKVLQSFECQSLGVFSPEITVAIYPNPTNDLLYLEILGDVSYEIYSALGKRVQEGFLSGDFKQIDISKLPAAIYFLNIEGKMHKIVKMN